MRHADKILDEPRAVIVLDDIVLPCFVLHMDIAYKGRILFIKQTGEGLGGGSLLRLLSLVVLSQNCKSNYCTDEHHQHHCTDYQKLDIRFHYLVLLLINTTAPTISTARGITSTNRTIYLVTVPWSISNVAAERSFATMEIPLFLPAMVLSTETK